MTRDEIKTTLGEFIGNEMLNFIDNQIHKIQKNFDYSERKDIVSNECEINFGHKIIAITGLSEIDDFFDIHNLEQIKYFMGVKSNV